MSKKHNENYKNPNTLNASILPRFLSITDNDNAYVSIPGANIIYVLEPGRLPSLKAPGEAVKEALYRPATGPGIDKLVNSSTRVLIIADDMTRPTPQKQLIPPLLEVLKECGVEQKSVSVLIALGSHRPMTPKEIETHFGSEVTKTTAIYNHEFNDPSMLRECGVTGNGTPITVNRRLGESDFVIGLSSIVPHAQVGWGGGCKIVLPGVSGEATVAAMHKIAAGQPGYPFLCGEVETPSRALIEEVARKAGLTFILNAIFNHRYRPAGIAAGDPVKAHRQGVELAKKVFIRPIPALADIVVCNAQPADHDYTQGLKPATLSCLGVRENGTIILIGDFPEGIGRFQNEFAQYGNLTLSEFQTAAEQTGIKDGLCYGALYQHIMVRNRAEFFCVSRGLTGRQKKELGFIHFDDIQSAIDAAFKKHGKEATVGIIDQGGEVVPSLGQ